MILFFWRLGFLNAWRNKQRSVLAIISMAIAAGFITYAISMSRGYNTYLYAPIRSYLGGEILIFNQKLSPTTGNNNITYLRSISDATSSVNLFYPEAFDWGYLSNSPKTIFDEEYLNQIAMKTENAQLYPRYQIPIMETIGDKQILRSLRGREYNLDANLTGSLSSNLQSGRWFRYGENDPVAVVFLNDQSKLDGEDYLGKKLEITIPRISWETDAYVFDFTSVQNIELEIIGIQYLSSHEITLTQSQQVIPLHWNIEEIQIPLPLWETIFYDALSDDSGTFIPSELAIHIEDQTYLEDFVVSLREEFPNNLIESVPHLVEKVHSQGFVENIEVRINEFMEKTHQNFELGSLTQDAYDMLVSDVFLAQRNLNLQGSPLVQGLPSDLRLITGLLVCFNSGLLLAANLLIIVSERRQEIATLKATGSLRLDLLIMTLAEASLLSMIGSLIGFLIMRTPSLLNQIISHLLKKTPLTDIAARFLIDGCFVISVTLAITIVFALMPAISILRVTVMAALRDE